jgi:transcriptional regulator with XRE-family HTH domain
MTDTSAVRKLRDVRNDAGLTLRELAEWSGVALSTVWQIEIGRQPRPQLATAMKICRALGADPYHVEEFRSVMAEVEGQESRTVEHQKPEVRSEPRQGQQPAFRSSRSLPEDVEAVVEQEVANVAGADLFEFKVDLTPDIVQKGAEQALDRLMEYLGKDTVDRIYERKFNKRRETRTDKEATE